MEKYKKFQNKLFQINDYFTHQPLDDQMTVLKPFGIGKALDQYSEIEEGGTAASANRNFDNCLLPQIGVVRNTLKKMPLPPIESLSDMESFRDLIEKDLFELKKADCERPVTAPEGEEDDDDERQFYMPQRAQRFDEQEEEDDDEPMNSDDEPVSTSSAKPTRGRGRGSRGGATTRGTRGKPAKAAPSRAQIDSDDDGFVVLDDSNSPPPPARATRGRGRAKATTTTRKRDMSFF